MGRPPTNDQDETMEGSMMVQLLVTGFIGWFVGLVAIGHVLLFQAIFSTKHKPDHSTDGQTASFQLPVPHAG
jgi:hypothetical protein